MSSTKFIIFLQIIIYMHITYARQMK